MNASTITPAELKSIPTFATLSDAQIQWLADHAEGLEVEVGETPFGPWTKAEYMYIFLSGRVQHFFGSEGKYRLITTYTAGSITGMLPYSRMTEFRGKGTAIERTRLALIRKDHFKDMLYEIPELGQSLIAMMSDRVRYMTRESIQRDKMMALGKLSAGLAHELNNPAAAVSRAGASLRERLAALPSFVARLSRHKLTEAQVCEVDLLRQKAQASPPGGLSTVERSEHEDELADWLDAHAVEKSWLVADTLTDAGISPSDLDHAIAGLPDDAVPDVIAWLEGSLAAEKLLNEIDSASERISTLVASVKTYSHMDQSEERQPTDVLAGIDSTVTMLEHKLRKKNIHVERQYQSSLPAVPVYAGELNQVWTNLIDNAVDAMDDDGVLRLEAEVDGKVLFVRIIDNGHGIPNEIQSQIFDPFFTTKAVGEGTGLGLDIVERIVQQRHNGTIQIDSKPGRTVFEIQLPLIRD